MAASSKYLPLETKQVDPEKMLQLVFRPESETKACLQSQLEQVLEIKDAEIRTKILTTWIKHRTSTSQFIDRFSDAQLSLLLEKLGDWHEENLMKYILRARGQIKFSNKFIEDVFFNNRLRKLFADVTDLQCEIVLKLFDDQTVWRMTLWPSVENFKEVILKLGDQLTPAQYGHILLRLVNWFAGNYEARCTSLIIFLLEERPNTLVTYSCEDSKNTVFHIMASIVEKEMKDEAESTASLTLTVWRCLLKAGASLDVKNRANKTPVDILLENKKINIIRLLLTEFFWKIPRAELEKIFLFLKKQDPKPNDLIELIVRKVLALREEKAPALIQPLSASLPEFARLKQYGLINKILKEEKNICQTILTQTLEVVMQEEKPNEGCVQKLFEAGASGEELLAAAIAKKQGVFLVPFLSGPYSFENKALALRCLIDIHYNYLNCFPSLEGAVGYSVRKSNELLMILFERAISQARDGQSIVGIYKTEESLRTLGKSLAKCSSPPTAFFASPEGKDFGAFISRVMNLAKNRIVELTPLDSVLDQDVLEFLQGEHLDVIDRSLDVEYVRRCGPQPAAAAIEMKRS